MTAPAAALQGAMTHLDRAAAGLPDGEERIALRAAWLILANARERIATRDTRAADRQAARAANRAANKERQDQLHSAMLAKVQTPH